MAMATAVVVGAGPGGLVAALGLHRAGSGVTVFETARFWTASLRER